MSQDGRAAPTPAKLDRVFVALSQERRRCILALLDRGEVDRVDDLLPRSRSKARVVEHELVNTHLPKLSETGYVAWDPASGAISKGPRFDEIKRIVDAIEEHEDGQWCEPSE